MFCILARAAFDKDDWIGRKMGETLGFHFRDRIVRIQTTLYLTNTLPDNEPNYVYVLHPGNVGFELCYDTPFPAHQDEKDYCILHAIYSNAFTYDSVGRELTQIKALSPWDYWYEFGKDDFECVTWPGSPRQRKTIKAVKVFPTPDSCRKGQFCPFSVCKIGPFLRNGATMFTLQMTLKGESFDELVGNENTFTVDGPRRLLSRIEHCYIPRIEDDVSAKAYLRELGKFEKFLKAGGGYDVVILNERFADAPIVIDKSCIEEAVIQLSTKLHGLRYNTTNCNFVMELSRDRKREMEAHIRHYMHSMRR